MLALGFQTVRQIAICVLYPLYDGSARKLQLENDGEPGEGGEEEKLFKTT